MKKNLLLFITLLSLIISSNLFAKQKYFLCRGNEPFWNMTIKNTDTTYKEIDGTNFTLPTVKPITARGHVEDYILVYKTNIKNTHKKVTLVLTHNYQGCSDGMSDKKSPYNIVIVFPNKVMAGCCDPAE